MGYWRIGERDGKDNFDLLYLCLVVDPMLLSSATRFQETANMRQIQYSTTPSRNRASNLDEGVELDRESSRLLSSTLRIRLSIHLAYLVMWMVKDKTFEI